MKIVLIMIGECICVHCLTYYADMSIITQGISDQVLELC